MNRLEHCIEVLTAEKRKMHAAEIATALVARYPSEYREWDLENLAKKVGLSIRSHIRSAKRNAKVARVPNGRGGHLSGVFIAKQKRKKTTQAKLPQVSTGYTGKAGEYGLLSELLFRGYNASIMTVDEGIDVVASRENKYFHIQVKRPIAIHKENFNSPFRRRAINRMMLPRRSVLITRRFIRNSWRSDYVVFQSSDIAKFIATGIVKDCKQYSLLVRYEGDNCLLNRNKDVTYHLNNFEPMK